MEMKNPSILRVKWMIIVMILVSMSVKPALCLTVDRTQKGYISDRISYPNAILNVGVDYQATGNIYYVSVGGNDANPGTIARPFRTMTRGVSVLDPGDTLYIRAGTYYERVDIRISGLPENPISIMAYPGEYPVIDAQNTLPGDYEDFIFLLRGDYLILSGLEIKNVYGSGVLVIGNYNIVRNMKIHHCLNKGILVSSGGYCPDSNNERNRYNIIEDNEIWMTSLIHEGVMDGGRTVGALTVARCPEYTIVRRNIVHETWGSAIQTHEAYSTTVEDNVVWNNQTTHYYINNAPYTLVQRNISYNTPDTIFIYRGRPGSSYAFCDERSEPLSHDVTIINNLSLGGDRGFYFWNQQDGSGLKNFLIANNTFVNSFTAGITIREGDHENSRILNNIVLEDNGTLVYISDESGLEFSHNLWSDEPPAAVSSSSDVIGNPHLAEVGSTNPGQLDPSWFELLPDSPAIDAGVILGEVPNDFESASRPRGISYDIGAYEFPDPTHGTDLRIVDLSAIGSPVSTTFGFIALFYLSALLLFSIGQKNKFPDS